MISIRIAVYSLIALNFLRMTARKLLRPAPRLAMPPAAPGDIQDTLTLGAMVRTGDTWSAFMVSGAATAALSDSQSSWLHHAMFTASDGLIRKLPGRNGEIRLCIWNPKMKKPHISAKGIAKMLGLSGTREARFVDRFHSLVRQFNEAVSR